MRGAALLTMNEREDGCAHASPRSRCSATALNDRERVAQVAIAIKNDGRTVSGGRQRLAE